MSWLLIIWLTTCGLSSPCAAQQGGTSVYVYDDNGRLRAVLSPTGQAAKYEYDAAGNFTAIRQPGANDPFEVLTFTPRKGAVGTQVTIYCFGLSAGVTSVAFNGVNAQILSTNANSIIATVPAGALTGSITVVTPRGSQTTARNFVVLRDVSIQPASVTLVSGASQQFNSIVQGGGSVTWSVNGINGGNNLVGTITSGGLYIAPVLSNPDDASFIVRASNVADPSSFGEAQVTVQPFQLTVNNTNDSGAGSLRQAILTANQTNGSTRIKFNIPGTGVRTIRPTSELPNITKPVFIDGYSQPGASPNTLAAGDNAVLLIELTGGGSLGSLVISGGKCKIAGLVINRFNGSGILLLFDAGSNRIEGNFIGTNAGGTADFGNNVVGVDANGSPNNIIGGNTPGARNIISGNNSDGVRLVASGARGNRIEGNFIGTDVSGNAAIGNSVRGVTLQDAPNNVVGGTEAGARNVISGNGDVGVRISGSSSTGNLIQGNFVGTNVAGTAAIANSSDGIQLFSGPSGNTIGGAATGAGNTIAFNRVSGVSVISNNSIANTILNNSIHDNIRLGIDLVWDGVTQNDAGDGDTGPNDLQNFPVLTAVTGTNNQTTIQGTLNSSANAVFTLQFFANQTCDASGNGEGQTFLGAAQVTTASDGNASFNVTFNTANLRGRFITATATNSAGNTSEFSRCFAVPTAAPQRAALKSWQTVSAATWPGSSVTGCDRRTTVKLFAFAGDSPWGTDSWPLAFSFLTQRRREER